MNNKKEYKIIAETLVEKGPFAISDIENKIHLSRTSVGNILSRLVDGGVLKKTAKKGSDVKYKMTISKEFFSFIFDYIDNLKIDEIALFWGVSVNSAKQYIKKFVDEGVVEKIGTPPQKIIYTRGFIGSEYNFSDEQKKIIQKFFMYTTPDGVLLKGLQGFIYWAENKSNRKDIVALAQEYLDTRKKYYGENNSVLFIDATNKLPYVFGENVFIEKLFHKDFDALPVFGKTALSQMVRQAKSGQANKVLMTKIVDLIQDDINEIILKNNIDCVGFIPPTVARKIQLMDFLSKNLKTNCQKISISKIKAFVPVQQKSLKKIEDRVLNAQKTIEVGKDTVCNNVLLIDDVTGSGATLNETAKKIIQQGVAKKVYAFTLTGSAKAGNFDVVSEA